MSKSYHGPNDVAEPALLKTNFVQCVYVVEIYSEEPTSTREESAPLLNWIFNSVGHFFLQRLGGYILSYSTLGLMCFS